jgi:hypothetical protein
MTDQRQWLSGYRAETGTDYSLNLIKDDGGLYKYVELIKDGEIVKRIHDDLIVLMVIAGWQTWPLKEYKRVLAHRGEMPSDEKIEEYISYGLLIPEPPEPPAPKPEPYTPPPAREWCEKPSYQNLAASSYDVGRQSSSQTKWYGWLILAAIIGLIVWRSMPEKQLTPAELQRLSEKADRWELQQAQKKCEDMEDSKLYNACVETERKRISDEYDERAQEEEEKH